MLKVAKTRLTKTRNGLEEVMSEANSFLASVVLPETRNLDSVDYLKSTKRNIESITVGLKASKVHIEHAMERFHAAFQQLEPGKQEDELVAYESYLETAAEVLENADVLHTKLLRRLSETELLLLDFQSAQAPQIQQNQGELQSTAISPVENTSVNIPSAPIYLPRLEIPKFSGRRSEWDNFWSIFKANIHDQPISPMLKFNYLWQYLTGEAKGFISQYQLNEENYPLAISYLNKKYGDNDTRVEELFAEIQKCRADSRSTISQIQLLERISALMNQLAVKGQDTNHRMLLNTIFSKFNSDVQTKALEKRSELEDRKNWTWPKMHEVIHGILERINYIERTREKINEVQQSSRKNTFQATQATKPWCIYCKRNSHQSTDCRTVPGANRLEFLQKNQLCHNCGKPNHTAEICRNLPCSKCGKKHHTSICGLTNACQAESKRISATHTQQTGTLSNHRYEHPESSRKSALLKEKAASIKSSHQNVVIQREDNESIDLEDQKVVNQVTGTTKQTNAILLTGTTTILGTNGSKEVKILLDTGSELSFIDTKLVEELHLPVVRTVKLGLKTFGSNETREGPHRVVEVKLLDKEDKIHKFRLFENNGITSHSATPQLTKEDFEVIRRKRLRLSTKIDKQRCSPQILLGCDQLWEMIDSDKQRLPSGLHLISTKFGYMISGQAQAKPENQNHVPSSAQTDRESAQYKQYWEFESSGTHEYTGPVKTERQQLDEAVAKRFRETIQKREDGYYVHLPWKHNGKRLPTNRSIALKRLEGLWHQLCKKPELLSAYNQIFEDQLSKGIIEPVEDNTTARRSVLHYLPHQAVITPDKPNTKVRIVFDASAHYTGKPSLNDALHQGPLFLPNLVGILQRFRAGSTALIADVEKAFLQVRLHEDDRDATRFLWLKSVASPPTSDNIIEYRFTRVTFGLNASPFLLAATIRFHLDTAQIDKDFAEELSHNLYVDNLLICAESTGEGIAKYFKAKNTFEELNMNLREFISNNSAVNKAIKKEDRSTQTSPKVFGIKWNTKTDTLTIRCDLPVLEQVTKRTVLHAIASIYDPMGWLTPLTIRNKVFFQSLWRKEFSWDEPLPEQEQLQWSQLVKDIHGFQRELPRCIADKSEHHRLVIFSDASTIAMSTCAYLCHGDRQDLIMSKSKLPKLKEQHTVPKLELNALTLSARLAKSIVEELATTIKIDSIYVLSDSEIALAWVKNLRAAQKSGVLVGNRVSEIYSIAHWLQDQSLPVFFGYVDTKSNPADCATRGLTKLELRGHFWWNGPGFINRSTSCWPPETRLFQLSQEEPFVTNTISQTDKWIDWKRFSSFRRLTRVAAWVLRFLRNSTRNLQSAVRRRIQKAIPELRDIQKSPSLNAEELKRSRAMVIKTHQKEYDHAITASRYGNLNIEKNATGIYVCHGRLGRSDLAEETKTPILIVPNSTLAELLIREAHGTMHRSISHTIAEVRARYWIPRLRQQVTKLIRKCIPCQKINNLPFRYPKMMDLPERRVIRSRPFEHIGLDYFGPLKTRKSTGETTKAYGCIWTCAATRLIHLELVSDNTTVAFVNAMRRFIARRGVPKSITCDNAPTFQLGAQIMTDSYTSAVNSDDVQSFLADQGINWIRITPYAPWQGGFYERLIQSIKRCLYKAMGRKVLEEDSLRTILIEAESCLNSRPLTYQEADWDNNPCLRPIDFLQNGVNLTYRMDPQAEDERLDEIYLPADEKLALRTRIEAERALRSSCDITERFWKQWRNQYITALREHHQLYLTQGKSTKHVPRVGQIVLIQEELQPRNTWKLGKIVKLRKDSAGVIRDVELMTGQRTTVRRPVNLLVPLELKDTENVEEIPDTKENRVKPHPYNLRSSKHTFAVNTITALDETCDVSSEASYEYPNDESFSSMEDVKKLLQELSMRPRSVLNERVLHEQIVAVNHEVDRQMKLSNDALSDYRAREQWHATRRTSPVKLYYERKNFDLRLTELHGNLQCACYISDILWDTYDHMVKAKVATLAKKEDLQKMQVNGRYYDKFTTKIYITSEIRSIQMVIQDIRSQTYPPWAIMESESLKDNIRRLEVQMQSFNHEDGDASATAMAQTHKIDNVCERLSQLEAHAARIENDMMGMMGRMEEKIDKAVNDVKNLVQETVRITEERITILLSSLTKTVEKEQAVETPVPAEELVLLEEDTEVLEKLPLKDTQETSIKETVEEKTRVDSHLKRRREESPRNENKPKRERIPMRIAEAKNRLRGLRLCPERKLYDRRSGRHVPTKYAAECVFCHERRKHSADACPQFPTVRERWDLINRQKLCKLCLERCRDRCKATQRCSYCDARTHHEALCALPEERKQLEEVISRYEQGYAAAGSVREHGPKTERY